MAALLAGARLVLRQGLRFLPAYSTVYRVLPAPVSVRYLHNSARFLTTALPDNGTVDVESVQSRDSPKTQPDGWSLHITGSKLKKNGRISKQHLLNTLENVCAAGKPSSNQAWFLLQACGSSMPEVPLAERTEIANTIWDRLQGMGVAFNEHHYNTLLKVYLENEHKFSPTEFLANMEANQIQANQSTYELLIAAYCHEGDIEGASKILGFMKSTDLPITEDVFSSLITGHARSGDMESAKNILSVMQGAGLVPRRGAYTALLCAYAEKGDIESINQTLLSCTTTPTDKGFLKVIYSLAKSGHSQLVPSIFDHMKNCTGYIQDVIKMCLALLTQGSGDTAILLAKKFLTVQPSDFDFSSQPGSFFLRHCVHLNLPAETIKNYAHEMASSELHHSPLQFALMCALEYGKKDLALNLIRTLKEEGLPVRPHYCWPLLASSSRKNDVQGKSLLFWWL
uniref:PROP1-like PPR domain-containing protein n=1 Tax=Pyxicephalus adspersus TaxID=30357 RepID=A0AAV3AL00_PYXAD|nr:TPA: hypothetical protein GDO54_011358 [Pyxicephalus adspersus]